MAQYFLTHSARQDLKEINHYLANFSPAAARKFKQIIKQRFQQITDFPNIGKHHDILHEGLQSLPMEDYLIFYRLVANRIEILRVLSGYLDIEALFPDDN